MLSDLLLALVIHVKCTNNAANTYLKCNRLKFTLNRARRALIQPRRRTGNGSTVRTVEPLMRHAWIMEYSGKPKRRPPTPTPGRNSPRQELKCLSFYLITRPLSGENGGDQRSTAGAAQGCWRERSLAFFAGLHGQRCEIHFHFASWHVSQH